MLIKTYENRVLNSRYIRGYAVERADRARSYPNGTGTTTHHGAPESGFVVVAWMDSKGFITDGLAETEAQRVLDELLKAYADGERVFDARHA